jgi:hypothetical protein
VRIVLGKELTHTPQTSIQGKSLPDLKELGLSEGETKDKPILLCFCDIEQRPSRQCLASLAKKSADLTAQGVVLVVVQVSPTDMGKYQTWLKDSGVAAPIHVFAGDFPVRKAAWGVGALPGLILTDRQHVVRAEGFGLGELESKTQAFRKE